MRRVLDAHNRCAVCGRPPSETCIESIHRAHDADWRNVLTQEGIQYNQMQPLAKRILNSVSNARS